MPSSSRVRFFFSFFTFRLSPTSCSISDRPRTERNPPLGQDYELQIPLVIVEEKGKFCICFRGQAVRPQADFVPFYSSWYHSQRRLGGSSLLELSRPQGELDGTSPASTLLVSVDLAQSLARGLLTFTPILDTRTIWNALASS